MTGEQLFGFLLIALGAWAVLQRKQSAISNAPFQRYMFPKMQPYVAKTIRRSEVVFGGVGGFFVLLGALMLVGN